MVARFIPALDDRVDIRIEVNDVLAPSGSPDVGVGDDLAEGVRQTSVVLSRELNAVYDVLRFTVRAIPRREGYNQVLVGNMSFAAHGLAFG